MTDLNVPWLRKGTGKTPADGGCILQVIDWIDRNEWTDRPVCVHPVIANLAIRANDTLDNEGRQKLLDLAPRIMGTASSDKVLSVRLAVFCARRVLPIFEAEYPSDDRPRKAIVAVEAWCEKPSKENADAAYAAAAYDAANAAAAADAASAKAAANAAAAAAHAAANDDAAAAKAAAYAAANAAAYAAAYAAANAAAGGADILALLSAVLDEYDRLTGRTETPVLDYGPVCQVMAA